MSGCGVGEMKNPKLLDPSTDETSSSKLQRLARLRGRIGNGAWTALSACFFCTYSRGQSCPRSCLRRFLDPDCALLACCGVWSLGFLLNFELWIWNFAPL